MLVKVGVEVGVELGVELGGGGVDERPFFGIGGCCPIALGVNGSLLVGHPTVNLSFFGVIRWHNREPIDRVVVRVVRELRTVGFLAHIVRKRS